MRKIFLVAVAAASFIACEKDYDLISEETSVNLTLKQVTDNMKETGESPVALSEITSRLKATESSK